MHLAFRRVASSSPILLNPRFCQKLVGLVSHHFCHSLKLHTCITRICTGPLLAVWISLTVLVRNHAHAGKKASQAS